MLMKIKNKAIHTHMYKNKKKWYMFFSSSIQYSIFVSFPHQFAEQFEENLWPAVHPAET